jgi:hypothetical protein
MPALALILSLLMPSAFADKTVNVQPKTLKSGVQVYKIPEPDNANGMIVEFANAIEGTDGTPQDIARKAAEARGDSGRQPQSARGGKKKGAKQPMPEGVQIKF